MRPAYLKVMSSYKVYKFTLVGRFLPVHVCEVSEQASVEHPWVIRATSGVSAQAGLPPTLRTGWTCIRAHPLTIPRAAEMPLWLGKRQDVLLCQDWIYCVAR